MTVFLLFFPALLLLFAIFAIPAKAESQRNGSGPTEKLESALAAQPVVPPSSPFSDHSRQMVFAEAMRLGLPEDALLMIIDTASQQAFLYSAVRLQKTYRISTSKFGIGNQSGSNRTPLGWHRVSERYGAKARPGTVFVSRAPNGRVLPASQWKSPSPAEDLVLTRVLWLTGLEPGKNAGKGIDSHERCIYLHGTNQEQLLGSVASHGCIRFSNADIIEIFSLSEGTELYCLIQ
ncbi:MAG: L,D-transpeptidase [Kiritimatiellia bacterium]